MRVTAPAAAPAALTVWKGTTMHSEHIGTTWRVESVIVDGTELKVRYVLTASDGATFVGDPLTLNQLAGVSEATLRVSLELQAWQKVVDELVAAGTTAPTEVHAMLQRLADEVLHDRLDGGTHHPNGVVT